MNLHDMLHHILPVAPFVLGVDQDQPKWNTTRFLEALLIALVSAVGSAAVSSVVASYQAGVQVQAQMQYVQQTMSQIRDDVKEMKRDLYIPRSAQPLPSKPN